jgi:hypothetical protein
MASTPKREDVDERIARLARADRLRGLPQDPSSAFSSGHTRSIEDGHATDGVAVEIEWGTPSPDVAEGFGETTVEQLTGTALLVTPGLWWCSLNGQASGFEIASGLGAGETVDCSWSVYVYTDGDNDLYSEGQLLYMDLDTPRIAGEYSGGDDGLIVVGENGIKGESTVSRDAGLVSAGSGIRIAADLDLIYLGAL